jgi:hypothetical protein
MKQISLFAVFFLGLAALAACSNGEIEDAAASAEQAAEQSDAAVPRKPEYKQQRQDVKIGAPFRFDYKIVGTPVVGYPLPIELTVTSTLGDEPITVSYAINDTTALAFPEAQPASVNVSPADGQDFIAQMVTVVPQREGRLYLNVSASVETEEGSRSMVMALPIQVGKGGRVDLQENGELATDEQGESIRSLPAKTD